LCGLIIEPFIGCLFKPRVVLGVRMRRRGRLVKGIIVLGQLK